MSGEETRRAAREAVWFPRVPGRGRYSSCLTAPDARLDLRSALCSAGPRGQSSVFFSASQPSHYHNS